MKKTKKMALQLLIFTICMVRRIDNFAKDLREMLNLHSGERAIIKVETRDGTVNIVVSEVKSSNKSFPGFELHGLFRHRVFAVMQAPMDPLLLGLQKLNGEVVTGNDLMPFWMKFSQEILDEIEAHHYRRIS